MFYDEKMVFYNLQEEDKKLMQIRQFKKLYYQLLPETQSNIIRYIYNNYQREIADDIKWFLGLMNTSQENHDLFHFNNEEERKTKHERFIIIFNALMTTHSLFHLPLLSEIKFDLHDGAYFMLEKDKNPPLHPPTQNELINNRLLNMSSVQSEEYAKHYPHHFNQIERLIENFIAGGYNQTVGRLILNMDPSSQTELLQSMAEVNKNVKKEMLEVKESNSK